MTSSSLGQCHSIVFCRTSFGTSTSTDPAAGGGDVERLAHRQFDVLRRHHELVVLVAERVMPTVSHSWKASLPIAFVGT